MHEEAAPLAKRRKVRRNVRKAVRLAEVGRAHPRVGVLGVDDAAAIAGGALLGNLPRLLERVPEAIVAHVFPARRNQLLRLLALVGVRDALQPQAHSGVRRLGVVALPLARLLLAIKRVRLQSLVRGVAAVAQFGAPPLVVLLHHGVHLLLLLRNVGDDLPRRHHPHLPMLLGGGLAVGAVLDVRLLGRALVDAVDVEHLRLAHRAGHARLLGVHRGEVVVEERKDGVAVVLKGDIATLLCLLQDGRGVLVEVPELAQQDVGRLDRSVHLLGQRRLEEVGHRRVVANVKPPLVAHVLGRLKVALLVVPLARVEQRRVDAQRLALGVEHARDGGVDARVARAELARLHKALVVVRDGGADGVAPAKLGVALKVPDLAAGRRVVLDVRVKRAPRVAVRLAAHRVEHQQPVLVVADALPLEAGRLAQVVVRHLHALQLVLPLQPLVALHLGHRVDLPRAFHLRVLVDERAHELVVGEGLVKDQHVVLDADELIVLVVRVAHAPAELLRHLLALRRVGGVAVGAVDVALDLAVDLLTNLLDVFLLLVGRARLRQLRVVLRAHKALGGAHGEHAHQGARGDGARLRRLVALRLDVADVLGVLLHLPGRDEAHAQHARGADLAPIRKGPRAGPLRPGVRHEADAEGGRHRVDARPHAHLRPPRHLLQSLPERQRGGRDATPIELLKVHPTTILLLVCVLVHVAPKPLPGPAPLALVFRVRVQRRVVLPLVLLLLLLTVARHHRAPLFPLRPRRPRRRGTAPHLGAWWRGRPLRLLLLSCDQCFRLQLALKIGVVVHTPRPHGTLREFPPSTQLAGSIVDAYT